MTQDKDREAFKAWYALPNYNQEIDPLEDCWQAALTYERARVREVLESNALRKNATVAVSDVRQDGSSYSVMNTRRADAAISEIKKALGV